MSENDFVARMNKARDEYIDRAIQKRIETDKAHLSEVLDATGKDFNKISKAVFGLTDDPEVCNSDDTATLELEMRKELLERAKPEKRTPATLEAGPEGIKTPEQTTETAAGRIDKLFDDALKKGEKKE